MIFERKKILKIAAILLAITLVIGGGIIIYLDTHMEKIIRTKAGDTIRQALGGLYKIEMGSVRLHLLQRKARFENIRLYADTSAFERMSAADSLPSLIADIGFDVLEFHGIRFKRKKGKIGLRELSMEKPDIRIIKNGNRQPAGKDSVPKNLYEYIYPALQSVNIRHINLKDGSFRYTVWGQDDTLSFSIPHLDLAADHFLVDSTAYNRSNRLYCDDIRLGIRDFSYRLPNGLFSVSFDEMRAGFGDSSLLFTGLRLLPEYDKQHFAIKNPRHTNWMELHMEQLICMRIDYAGFFSRKMLYVDSIFVGNASYTNMKNRIIEQAPIEKPMLYEFIQKTPFPLNIRTVHISPSSILYEDLPEGKTVAGTLTFNKLEGDAFDVTNIITQENQYMTIKATAYVQDEGILKAVFRFPVDPDNDHFEITGNMGKVHLDRFNTMSEPFHVRIREGTADHLYFTIHGRKKDAHLDMLFLYQDLHISLLKEKDDQLVRRNFLSGIANGMLLYNDNPSKDEEPRYTKTVTERNIYRASFHYFWHILMDGMKESIGITLKRQNQIKWLKQTAEKMHILKEDS